MTFGTQVLEHVEDKAERLKVFDELSETFRSPALFKNHVLGLFKAFSEGVGFAKCPSKIFLAICEDAKTMSDGVAWTSTFVNKMEPNDKMLFCLVSYLGCVMICSPQKVNVFAALVLDNMREHR